MAYRRLLLPLTGTAAGEAALHTALMVARIWNAHVHCLHVRVDARDVAPLAGEGLSGAMIEEMMAATERESGDRASRVQALFNRFVDGKDVVLASSAEAAEKADAATLSFASVAGRETPFRSWFANCSPAASARNARFDMRSAPGSEPFASTYASYHV